MIIDKIDVLVERMERVRKLEQDEQYRRALREAEKQFRKMTHDVTEFVTAYVFAREELRFEPSVELFNALTELLKSLGEIPSTGLIKKETVQSTDKQFKAIRSLMCKEWADYYPMLTEVREILYVIQSFDENRVEKCLSGIDGGKSWTTNVDTLQKLANALHDANELIDSLNMDKEVVFFLSSVAEGRARVSDLSEQIMDWIERERLENRIALRFVSE